MPVFSCLCEIKAFGATGLFVILPICCKKGLCCTIVSCVYVKRFVCTMNHILFSFFFIPPCLLLPFSEIPTARLEWTQLFPWLLSHCL